MLRVLVVDETRSRADELKKALSEAGCTVAAVLPSSLDLISEVERVCPDLVLIDTESPSRDTLEQIGTMDERAPRPVVMLAHDRGRDTIRAALRAGVATYLVDGLDPARVQPVLEVAVATFENFQSVRRERDEAKQKLTDRKLIEKAKGALMKARNMDEDTAYKAMRKLAMDRGKTMAAVAQDVLDMLQFLG